MDYLQIAIWPIRGSLVEVELFSEMTPYRCSGISGAVVSLV